MFPLKCTTFPSSAEALERLLNESLRRLFDADADSVTVRDASYPALAEISVSLDGARLHPNSPRPELPSGETSPALQVDRFSIRAVALAVGPAAVDLSLSARALQLVQGKDDKGEIVLSPHGAAEGKIEISAPLADLEEAIAKIARSEAGKHGVKIDNVQLTLREKSAHSLEAEVRLRAQKLFMSATIRVTGRLDLDEKLNAKISGLNCKGDGAIAAIACGVLNPHLQKLEGREFSLLSLELGEIRLRDVRLAVNGKLAVSAEFGSAT